ncbi:Nod factor export ATP-binding protein I [Candidatus Hydrogenisulfobacillus filiaventi]|uniref:Nod factor export ATP-binding protein I n=1 Tax=Candidatus Hydrogenisulfobacillus filiaventi TaxID=2707344 RepID=A0A6F8ZF11_9FIRM|nr:ABC transporter ATP-binding protein [Bacillota bacterium]CAB1128284.1 Nod factor export ATP-binding protein I [Candidatus Hydrogenisulfobacillus filiaventi]
MVRGDALLEVEDIRKRYGPVTAVDGISFTVPAGIVFGLLGPNGAGKTTTLELCEGLRRADAGHIRLEGLEVWSHRQRVKSRIGLQLQSTSFFDYLTVQETLEMFGRCYPRALPAHDLIARFGLEDKARTQVRLLSGGQRQRLAVALALVNDPGLVFLDEPTAGLDPQSRRALWEAVAALRTEGKTVVLTTHYMEEAEALCDRLVIVDHGRVIAEGSPQELIARHLPQAVIEFAVPAALPPPDLPGISRQEVDTGRLRLYTTAPAAALTALVQWAAGAGVPLTGLSTRTPTLEDLFLTLTGRSLRD